MLRQRLLSAVIAIPLLVAATLVGDGWFLAGTLVASLWALTEWLDLLEQRGFRPLSTLALVATTVIVVDTFLGGRYRLAVLVAAAALGVVLIALRHEPYDAIGDWSVTLGGIVYCGLFLSYYVLLRALPEGASWVLVVLLGTFACDSAAYFVGRRFGTSKLAPAISPGKTREGAAAGLVASIVAYTVLTLGAGLLTDWRAAVVLGALAGIACELGDLAESAFKRSLRAKDASETIPGHGGMLDRIDSLVLAGVVVYYFNDLLRFA